MSKTRSTKKQPQRRRVRPRQSIGTGAKPATDLLTQADLMNWMRLSRCGLYFRRRDDERFPKPLQLGGRLLWRASEVETYIGALPRVTMAQGHLGK